MNNEAKTLPLFDTVPFYKAQVDKGELKNRMLELLEQEKAKDRSVQKSNQGGFQTDDFCQSEIAQPFLQAFVPDIKSYLQNFKIYRNFRVDLSGLWVNSNLKNHFNMPHSHSPDFFSGVWYLKVPPESGGICFLNPIAQNTFNYPHFFSDARFHDTCTYHCKDDDLILFPSYVTHFVYPNLSDEERISVAFNFNLAP